MRHSVSLNARTTMAYNEPNATGISRIMAVVSTLVPALLQTGAARGKE
jgi:hypothetical protein